MSWKAKVQEGSESSKDARRNPDLPKSSAKHKNAKRQNTLYEAVDYRYRRPWHGSLVNRVSRIAGAVLYPICGNHGLDPSCHLHPGHYCDCMVVVREAGASPPAGHYAGVGIAWVLIAVLLDYLFIVLLFQASYYGTGCVVLYTVTFLIPVGVGLYLNRKHKEQVSQQG